VAAALVVHPVPAETRYGGQVTAGNHAVHLDPVWRGKADYIIKARVPDENPPKEFEQLWARQIDDVHFEICCIPYFLYDVALGDIVRCFSDGSNLLQEVVRPSGRYVFRAIFTNKTEDVDDIVQQLQLMGVLMEWSSRGWMAMDVEDRVQAQILADYLAELEDHGRLKYETGRLQPEE
jgi:hypothetical protein